MHEPRYNVLTWDCEIEAFTPQEGMTAPTQGITISQVRAALKELKECGYTCHRVWHNNGNYSGDPFVWVERIDD